MATKYRGITFGQKYPDILWEVFEKIMEEDKNGINKPERKAVFAAFREKHKQRWKL